MLKNGKRIPITVSWPVDPLSQAAIRRTEELTDSFIELYSKHPAIRYIMLTSEQRSLPGAGPEISALAQKELGWDFTEVLQPDSPAFLNIPDELKVGGVIADDNRAYAARKWFHERGHGTVTVNELMANRIRSVRPDLTFSHEPWRNALTRDVAKGLDHVGTWTYAYNDLKRLFFLRYLRAPGRKEDQGVQAVITLYVYAHMVMPLAHSKADLSLDKSGSDPFFNASPDYVREALWLTLSLRPDEISVYWASLLPPEDRRIDPHHRSPASFHVLSEFAEEILQPFGPALKTTRPVQAKVALLASAADSWFTERNPGYNITEGTLPYASLLVMNDVPFDVFLDDDITEGGLQGYEAVVIPLADTLTEGMLKKLREFVANGGKVIVNDHSPLGDAAHQTGFDFEPLSRQTGIPIASGAPITTAEEARSLMEGYAKELAPLLAPYRGTVTSPSSRVVINSLKGENARYDFIINDERTYGPRFGEHQLHFENGVRQQATLRFDTTDYPVIYDLTSAVQLATSGIEGTPYREAKLWLPAAGGKLLLALPEEIGRLQVEGPTTLEAAKKATLKISLLSKSGAIMKHHHPIHVRVEDSRGTETGWSRYMALQNGSANFTFTPAYNDAPGRWAITVTDLATQEARRFRPTLIQP